MVEIALTEAFNDVAPSRGAALKRFGRSDARFRLMTLSAALLVVAIFIGKQRPSARMRSNRGKPASASAAIASTHASCGSRCGRAGAGGATSPPSVRMARGFFISSTWPALFLAMHDHQ